MLNISLFGRIILCSVFLSTMPLAGMFKSEGKAKKSFHAWLLKQGKEQDKVDKRQKNINKINENDKVENRTMVNALLSDPSCDPNAVINAHGDTLLIHSVRILDVESVKLLTDHPRINVNQRNKKMAQYPLAVIGNQVVLQNIGASRDEAEKSVATDPLVAQKSQSLFGNIEQLDGIFGGKKNSSKVASIYELLVNKGARHDYADKDGETHLMAIVRLGQSPGHVSSMLQIASKSHYLNMRNKNGKTAYQIAMDSGRADLAKALELAGADTLLTPKKARKKKKKQQVPAVENSSIKSAESGKQYFQMHHMREKEFSDSMITCGTPAFMKKFVGADIDTQRFLLTSVVPALSKKSPSSDRLTRTDDLGRSPMTQVRDGVLSQMHTLIRNNRLEVQSRAKNGIAIPVHYTQSLPTIKDAEEDWKF